MSTPTPLYGTTALPDTSFVFTDRCRGHAARGGRHAPFGGGAEERRYRLRGHDSGTATAAARERGHTRARARPPPRPLLTRVTQRITDGGARPSSAASSSPQRNGAAAGRLGRCRPQQFVFPQPRNRSAATDPHTHPPPPRPQGRTAAARASGSSPQRPAEDQRPAPPRGSGQPQGDSRDGRLGPHEGPEDATGLRPNGRTDGRTNERTNERTDRQPPRPAAARPGPPAANLPAALPPGRGLGAPKRACVTPLTPARTRACRCHRPSCQGWRVPAPPGEAALLPLLPQVPPLGSRPGWLLSVKPLPHHHLRRW